MFFSADLHQEKQCDVIQTKDTQFCVGVLILYRGKNICKIPKEYRSVATFVV
jgi:hypothetical protein